MNSQQSFDMTHARRTRVWAFAALLIGGSAVGFSPILVRLSDVGPAASAFWRLALAAPFLWLWVATHSRESRSMPRVFLWPALLAGIFFAADLAVWHWSIAFTTIANSTLLANFAPIFVTLGAWWLYGERISRVFLAGMVAAIIGTSLLVGPSVQLGGTHAIGDLLGVCAGVFYAGYMLAVKRVRAGVSTAVLMAVSTTISVAMLLPVMWVSPQPMLPANLSGWGILFALALISQVVGQGLITYAFAHLSAALSSIAVLTQPIVAAAIAWMWFDEVLVWWQLIGAALVLAGIFIARRSAP